MKKKAFTLIELLVVIAIIALLLSIVLPSLKTAKEAATAAVCLARESQLLKAWIAYAQENKDMLASPDVGTVTYLGKEYKGWVEGPQDIGGNPVPYNNHTLEDEIRGIRKGTLYPYYKDEKLVHCPADKRYLNPPAQGAVAGVGGYRTYSFLAHVGTTQAFIDGRWGAMVGKGWALKDGEYCKKLSEIPSPGSKFVSVEENDPRGLDGGSWCFSLATPCTIDAFAVFHNMRSILGFGDGHVEKVVWKDKRTEKYSNEVSAGTREQSTGMTPEEYKNNEDMQWLLNHYARRK